MFLGSDGGAGEDKYKVQGIRKSTCQLNIENLYKVDVGGGCLGVQTLTHPNELIQQSFYFYEKIKGAPKPPTPPFTSIFRSFHPPSRVHLA